MKDEIRNASEWAIGFFALGLIGVAFDLAILYFVFFPFAIVLTVAIMIAIAENS